MSHNQQTQSKNKNNHQNITIPQNLPQESPADSIIIDNMNNEELPQNQNNIQKKPEQKQKSKKINNSISQFIKNRKWTVITISVAILIIASVFIGLAIHQQVNKQESSNSSILNSSDSIVNTESESGIVQTNTDSESTVEKSKKKCTSTTNVKTKKIGKTNGKNKKQTKDEIEEEIDELTEEETTIEEETEENIEENEEETVGPNDEVDEEEIDETLEENDDEQEEETDENIEENNDDEQVEETDEILEENDDEQQEETDDTLEENDDEQVEEEIDETIEENDDEQVEEETDEILEENDDMQVEEENGETDTVSSSLPSLITFDFIEETSKTIKADSSQSCSGIYSESDTLENLILVVQDTYGYGCWTDGRYNSLDYNVVQGKLQSSENVQYDCYKVSGPQTAATQGWHASETAIFYQFDKQEDYSIYTFDGFAVKLLANIAASDVDVDSYTQIPSSEVSKIASDDYIIYIFAKASDRISDLTLISDGVEGANIYADSTFNLDMRKYEISGNPYTPEDWSTGPGSWAARYSTLRIMFNIEGDNKGVFWQDKSDDKLYLTIFKDKSSTTTEFPSDNDFKLGAAIAGSNNQIYYIVMQNGNAGDGVSVRTAYMYKCSSDGSQLVKMNLDTSSTGLNLYAYDTSCILAYSNQKNILALHISKTNTLSSDGLNHQSATAVIYDGDTLEVFDVVGQTSSHSFGNDLSVDINGNFVGMDLGDNYPRGIHFWTFDDENNWDSSLIYSFKTCHSTTSNGFDEYTEISTSDVTYYKWSNDNEVYTELPAGFAQLDDSQLIFFIGENPSLNNSLACDSVNTARNIGFVKTSNDFSQDPFVISEGGTETGGFYTFNGGWSPQENVGINWITDYTDKDTENASRLKHVRVDIDKNLLVYEIWTQSDYQYTILMLCDDDGQVLKQVKLDYELIMHRADNMALHDGKVIIYTGDNESLVVWEITV